MRRGTAPRCVMGKCVAANQRDETINPSRSEHLNERTYTLDPAQGGIFALALEPRWLFDGAAAASAAGAATADAGDAGTAADGIDATPGPDTHEDGDTETTTDLDTNAGPIDESSVDPLAEALQNHILPADDPDRSATDPAAPVPVTTTESVSPVATVAGDGLDAQPTSADETLQLAHGGATSGPYAAEPGDPDPATQIIDANRAELVFIDTGLSDWQTLADGVAPGAEVVLLDPAADGITQIAKALDGRTGIDAIHLVGHGTDGVAQLGNAILSQDTVETYAAELQAWGAALEANGDILFYGCDIGAGAEGAALVNRIADLTGADVAASSDPTGHQSEGGDWVLETTRGPIEADVFAEPTALGAYDGLLVAPQFTGLNGGTTFTEGGPAVVIDSDVTVADAELDALNGGNGNYNGASLTVAREGGANGDDTFSFSSGGGISLLGGELLKGGNAIASLASSAGTLTVTFTDANGTIPTSADVDAILQRITYANLNATPPTSVALGWSFSDGSLAGTGTATVTITRVNDAPTISAKIPQTFTTHKIDTNADDAVSVYAAYLDGDGDMDLLSASEGDDTVAWYRNDGAENFTKIPISTTASDAASVYAIDVDGDGDVDVLSAGDDTIAWYSNNGSGSFTGHTIASPSQGNAVDGGQSVFAMDLDSDGDVDVLSASMGDDTIAWYENDGSEGFTKHIITSLAERARSVYAADVDGDGDVDVLSASQYDHTIAWYENDGSEGFTKRAITTDATGAR